MDFLFLKPFPHVSRPIHTPRFLIMTKGEMDRPLRFVTLPQQLFRCLQDADQLVFNIQGTPTPNEPVYELAFEWRMCPFRRIGGDYILVRHKLDWLQLWVRALPNVEQAVTVYHLFTEVLVNKRIGFFQEFVQLLKSLWVWRAGVIQRHGFTLDGFGKMRANLVRVGGDALLHRNCAVTNAKNNILDRQEGKQSQESEKDNQ